LIAFCASTASGGLFKSLFGGKGSNTNENSGGALHDIWDYVLAKIEGGFYNEKTIFEDGVDDEKIVSAYKDLVDGHLKTAASKPVTLVSNRTVKNMIKEDRRFVLFNSRRLTGECLPICYEPTPAPIAESITEPPVMIRTMSPTQKPTTASPTNKPTDAPTTASPTNKPTDAPTTATPTNKPTDAPTTAAPTNKPTDAPTTASPTSKPTAAPTTASPTNKPTGTPTKATAAPVPPPTPSNYECVWPSYLHKWTGIIKGDFQSEAHTIRHDLATEGLFTNPNNYPSTISPGGKIWYGEMGNGLFNFNGGKQQIGSFDEVNPTIDYAYFEWLAMNIKSSTSGNKIVKVFTEGGNGSGRDGCYTLSDIDPAESAQPTTGPQYLAVFNTHDDICLENNQGNGRQFGPSVLAPFSKVDLRAAYIDGVFISKEFTCFDGSVQLHGEGYNGPIECVDEEASVPPPAPDCDWALANLGDGFSGATGPNAFDNNGCWPKINTIPNNFGRDDSVNLFVGGNAVIGPAVEAEGKIVIMGNLNNKGNGWKDVTAVGAGYQVLPNDYSNCLVVGGDVSTKVGVRVGPGDYNYQNVKCNMVYGTSNDNSVTRFQPASGTVQPLSQSSEDMNRYEEMADVWYQKSQYWKTLDANGSTSKSNRYLNFNCGTNEDTYVFDFQPSDLNGVDKIQFASSCNDKTLLVNVKVSGYIKVKTVEMLPMSNMQRAPECNIAKNLLWNFPDATHVEIGGGGTDEWIGATLVTGDLTHHTSGMSGRVIVLGDLEHAGTSGSEFHAMVYDPPKPLPDPYCEDYTSGGSSKPRPSPTPAPGAKPTPTPAPEAKPTPTPTDAPVPDSGGGNGNGGPAWGSGCKAEWDSCNNNCCDGLYCDVMSWGSQCKKDNSATCLVIGLDCTGRGDAACCNGLKCNGSQYYASCGL